MCLQFILLETTFLYQFLYYLHVILPSTTQASAEFRHMQSSSCSPYVGASFFELSASPERIEFTVKVAGLIMQMLQMQTFFHDQGTN